MALRQIDGESEVGLTFDDVLLVPGASDVMPGEVNVSSQVTKTISVNIPIISSAMDTVTEARLAVAVAQAGGIGVIHRNLTPEVQAEHVRQVKKYESGIVLDPVTIAPNASLSLALELMAGHGISGIPVVEPNSNGNKTGRLVGILTNRDVRFATNLDQPVSSVSSRSRISRRRRSIPTRARTNRAGCASQLRRRLETTATSVPSG
jgi:IMP dehydrogenase